MKTAIALIALLLATPALAQEVPAGLTSGSVAVTNTITTPPWYSYEPKDDITAPELSKVITLLWPALVCRHYLDDCGVVKAIDEAPPGVKRHFVRHEN